MKIRFSILPSISLALLLLLAGCGGGGGGGSSSGGTLTVSINYSSDAYLFHFSSIVPTLTGFQGHAPNCSLASGTLPQGMTLNSDCSITGIPTQLGVFNIVVHIGASGVSNQIDWSVGFAVFGPSVVYNFANSYTVGDVFDISPLNVFWTPLGNETVTYSIVTGSLPPGLILDANTGRIHGAITAAGSYSFKVMASASNGVNTATTTQQFTNNFTAGLPTVDYSSPTPWTSQAFTATPNLPLAGATYQFSMSNHNGANNVLPPGLALDSNTGIISGTPTTIVSGNYGIAVQVSSNGAVFTTYTTLSLNINSPVYIFYPGGGGTPYVNTPSIHLNSPTPVPGATYFFTIPQGMTLPSGLSLNPTTGVISGTPTGGGGSSSLSINVVITNNGISFPYTALVVY
ncbi:MAG TPA: putative Ig domain-containing protein [Burkholderiaceae bacterium]|jgi:hypothetical protein